MKIIRDKNTFDVMYSFWDTIKPAMDSDIEQTNNKENIE